MSQTTATTRRFITLAIPGPAPAWFCYDRQRGTSERCADRPAAVARVRACNADAAAKR